MGIRESIEKNPAITVVVTVVAVLVAGVFAARQLWTSPRTLPTKAFFTVDDGKTWFAAGKENLPPFDHDGKTAYRLVVFTCDGGKTTFAGYLERYTPEAKKKLETQVADAIKQGKSVATVPFYSPEVTLGGTEVKKPGEGNPWINSGDHVRSSKIMSFDCPNGGNVDSVLPE